eukprot:SAG22_NODE_14057_length_386_cov_0.759582_1_plen_49_part_01
MATGGPGDGPGDGPGESGEQTWWVGDGGSSPYSTSTSESGSTSDMWNAD